jgi:hypothetical protein
MRVSYMPDYQKVVLVLLQLLLVLMARSGYDHHHQTVFFSHSVPAIYALLAIIADLGQGREDDMLHC